jgi:prepilin-type N-terminal cleavage/methylation domain-containing protein
MEMCLRKRVLPVADHNCREVARGPVPSSHLRRSERGFSFVEVLVCLAIIGSSAVVLMGAIRQQALTVSALQRHSEARILLEQMANTFQYGDGFHADSLVAGVHGTYSVRFQESGHTSGAELPMSGPLAAGRTKALWNAGDVAASDATGIPFIPTTNHERSRLGIDRYRISVHWSERTKPMELALTAWRFSLD